MCCLHARSFDNVLDPPTGLNNMFGLPVEWNRVEDAKKRLENNAFAGPVEKQIELQNRMHAKLHANHRRLITAAKRLDAPADKLVLVVYMQKKNVETEKTNKN